MPTTVDIKGLTKEQAKKVQEYIEILRKEAKEDKTPKKMHFNWEGGLSKFKNQYNSVDLQDKSLEWW